jgi:uncharacterized SAM-binding protein YcdF (DUF218 family)
LIEGGVEHAFVERVNEWQTEDGTGGGAHGFRIVRIDGALEKDGAARAESFGSAQDRTGVARLLKSIEHNSESLAAKGLVESPGGRLDESDDALGRFGRGDFLKKRVGQSVDAGPVETAHVIDDGVLDRLGGEHCVNGTVAAKGFFEQVETFGDGEAIFSEAAMEDASANAFEKRIFCAAESFDFHRLRGGVKYNRRPRIPHMKRILWAAAGIATFLLVVWLFMVARAIKRQSTVDEARPADIIVVLGAAEYRGRPSPVLEARLNHALFLYLQHLAPLIVTTGGSGGDPVYTESEVGRAYLSRRGVPSEAILVEPEGESTAYSTAAVAEIMRRRGLQSCILVSDGYHIYRVKRMLQAQGIVALGSPRPWQPKGGWREDWLYWRQAVAYGLWRIGVNI